MGAAYKPPSAFWGQFGDKRTYVALAELSTLLFALAALTPIMQNADLTVFCDSLVVVAGVAKGSSAAPELEALHLAIHHWAVRIGCRLHIEYVDSYSNLAGGPSREGVSCAIYAELGCSSDRSSGRSPPCPRLTGSRTRTGQRPCKRLSKPLRGISAFSAKSAAPHRPKRVASWV